MRVSVAKNAGFCFGVKRAIDMAVSAAAEAKRTGKKIYSVGQIVHNRHMSDYLTEQGIIAVSEADLPKHADVESMFIFPSHGKKPTVYDIVKNKGCVIVDTVCPCVSFALGLALKAREDGCIVLIYGDKGHDEITGYEGWLGEACIVVKDYEDDLKGYTLPEKIAVMAQTTTDQREFESLVKWLRNKGCDPLVIDSVCDATRQRREAAVDLAGQVDLMLVLGDASSANTTNLAAYCAAVLPQTYKIDSAEDIDFMWLYGVESIGITAGASTPDWIIEEVVSMTEEFKTQDEELYEDKSPELESQDAVTEAEPEAELTAEAQTEPEPEVESIPDEEPVQAEESEADVQAASATVEQDEPISVETQQETADDDADSEYGEANFSELEAEMGYLSFNPGDLVKGTVVKISSDEVLVDIGYKSEGIIPAFELAFTKVDPFSVVSVGDEFSVEVVKEDRDGNIILSRKNAMYEEKIDLLEEHFEKGEPISATVIDVVKGGLLVDVGMRGFVPASHVERGFVRDLSEYLQKTLDFKILELNRQGRKVILSRKTLLEDEYQNARKAFWDEVEEGQTRKGVVRRITDFGAFVDIGGCDGLLHVSEMGWGKVGKPSDVLSIKDEIEVYVLKVDREKEKVSLSLKKLIPNPWDLASDNYQIGGIYNGKVVRTAYFGAFIQLEPSLEGLAHISQLARFRVNKVEDVLVEGMEVPVKVLEIDLERRRISLSVREAIDLPKLVSDEPEADTSDAAAASFDEEEISVDSFNKIADEESAGGTVADALGEAMAGMVADAVADSMGSVSESEEISETPVDDVPEAVEVVEEEAADAVAEEIDEVVAEAVVEAVDEVVEEAEAADEVVEEADEEADEEAQD